MLDVLHRNELSDSEVLRHVTQVATGMEYLHSQDILHCDLAARNISHPSHQTTRVLYCAFSFPPTPLQRAIVNGDAGIVLKGRVVSCFQDLLQVCSLTRHTYCWLRTVLSESLISPTVGATARRPVA